MPDRRIIIPVWKCLQCNTSYLGGWHNPGETCPGKNCGGQAGACQSGDRVQIGERLEEVDPRLYTSFDEVVDTRPPPAHLVP